MIIRKSRAEIDRIARAGDLVAETIAHVGERIEPFADRWAGITALPLRAARDRAVDRVTQRREHDERERPSPIAVGQPEQGGERDAQQRQRMRKPHS